MDARVPTLRPDVRLSDVGAPGSPAWTLHDPVRGRYVRIGWLEFELLARWSLGEPARIVAAATADGGPHATPADLERLVALLEAEELVTADAPDALERLGEHARARRRSPVARAFGASLHVRRSLVDPEPLLRALTRALGPVLDRPRAAAWTLALLALGALILAQRHALELGAAIERWLTPAGAVALVATLVAVNVAHELGHGIAAARAGCRVRRMGVALVFLVPVAWCDTSDAWRLGDRRARLAIDAGGIAVEAVLAVLALWAWLLLPDGPARALALFVALSSFATTLLINLNPFMKFDGYFLLSDACGVENLQARSFESLKWYLRRAVVGEPGTAPPPCSIVARRRLAAYALATAAYRLALYLGIAWIVYEFWFKAAGVVMAGATLALLLVRPAASELAAWVAIARRRGARGRPAASLAVAALLLALFVVPLPRTVDAPAALAPAASARVHAPTPARLDALHVATGERVRAGQPIATLADPALEHALGRRLREREALVQARRAESGRRGARRRGDVDASPPGGGSGRDGRSPALAAAVADAALAGHDAAIAALTEERAALVLRAPVAGEIVRVDERLRPGLWLEVNAVVAEIATTDAARVRAYVDARDVRRVDALFAPSDGASGGASDGAGAGARGGARFVPDDGGRALDLAPLALAPDAVERLTDPMLATVHGGRLPAVPATLAPNDPAGRATADEPAPLAPLGTLHLASLAAPRAVTGDGLGLTRERTGRVRLAAAPASLALRTFERVYGAVIRESGF